ncbi:alpha/beta fold hydrolase [Pseudomonas umsongensis]|uniref:alpha/beta fold hydrolase n=1 Tax=Pseudomonas umsongensis TaxID=198618 RepID=UPI003ECEBEDB
MTDWPLAQSYRFNGHNVRYAVRGDGPPLVFVHGTPFSSFVWHRIAPHFIATHRVYYFDLLSYGQSEKVDGDVSLGVQNLLLAQLLEHWGLDRPDVVAHDFGGATALRSHLLNGKDYRSLTLIDPVALTPWGSPFVQHVRQYEGAFSGVPDYIQRAIVATYIRGAIKRDIPDDELAPYVQPWLGDPGQAAFYRQIAQMDERYTREAEGLYSTIRCPVQILWGKDDQWIPIERGRALQQIIPGAQFHAVANAGHLVQEDAPEAIIAALMRFLPLAMTA